MCKELKTWNELVNEMAKAAQELDRRLMSELIHEMKFHGLSTEGPPSRPEFIESLLRARFSLPEDADRTWA